MCYYKVVIYVNFKFRCKLITSFSFTASSPFKNLICLFNSDETPFLETDYLPVGGSKDETPADGWKAAMAISSGAMYPPAPQLPELTSN